MNKQIETNQIGRKRSVAALTMLIGLMVSFQSFSVSMSASELTFINKIQNYFLEQVSRTVTEPSSETAVPVASFSVKVGETLGLTISRTDPSPFPNTTEYCSISTNGTYAKLALSPTGTFSATINNFAFPSNSSGLGTTQTFYLKGISPTTNLPLVVTCQTTNVPTKYFDVLPGMELDIRATGFTVMAVGETRYHWVEVRNGPPNYQGTVGITTASISAGTGTPRYLGLSRLAQDPQSNLLILNVSLDANGNGQTAAFRVKALEAGETTQNVHAQLNIGGNAHVDQINWPIVHIQSIWFERQPGEVPIDDNPNLGGGLRVFPEKKTPTDGTFGRNQVIVRAKIWPVKSNISVKFRIFDVDDPETAFDIDSNFESGDDNRGPTSLIAVGANGAVVDSQGIASQSIIVSPKPGDNFRVAATAVSLPLQGVTYGTNPSLDEVQIDGSELTDSGPAVLNNVGAVRSPLVASQMMTTWRRLHIERDSMGPVSGNFVTGNIGSITPGTRTTRLALTFPFGRTGLESDRFENGRIFIHNDTPGSGFSMRVVENGPNTAIVEGTVPSISVGWEFEIYDDDDFNSDDAANLDGDNGENIPAIDTSLLKNSSDPAENKLAPAYIIPTYDLTGESRTVPFLLNIPGPSPGERDVYGVGTSPERILSMFRYDNVATASDPGFWTAYLLMGYQGPAVQDIDPLQEALTVGGYTGIVDKINGQGAIILIEAIKEKIAYFQSLGRPITDRERAKGTTVHEIGHVLGSRHPDGGVMCPTFVGDLCGNATHFSPTSIHIFRSLDFVYHPVTPEP